MMSTCCSKHVEAWNKYIERECVKLVINQNYVKMHGQQNIKFFYTQSENFVIFLRFLAQYIPDKTCLFTISKTCSSPCLHVRRRKLCAKFAALDNVLGLPFCSSSINDDTEVTVAYFTTILQNSPQANAVTVKNLQCIVILSIRFEPGTYVTEVTSVTAASNSSVTLVVIHAYRSGKIPHE
jgi:hypothetical protein